MSSIRSTIPASKRRPGAFNEFVFLPAGGSLDDAVNRVVIVAEKSAAGTADPEVPTQVFDENDADTKAGKGSFAALMARVAFAQIKLSSSPPASGGPVEVWICPTIAPAGGAAAVETITITGPATESGNLVLRIGGRLVTVGVTSGDVANTIAAAIEAKLDEMVNTLPITASVAAAVVTCTNVTKGVNGNDVVYETISKPAGVGVAFAQTVAGAGTAPIANPLAALYDKKYEGIALNNHTTGDATTILTDVASRWSFSNMNYGFVFLGERGSLGTAQTLEAAYNDFRVHVVSCEQAPSLPGELAVAVAVAMCSRELPNANLDGETLALVPPSPTYAYIDSEVESALSSGVTPLTPDRGFLKIERLVTTQITLNSAQFEPLRDTQYPRTAAWMAEQVQAGFLAGFRQEVLDDDPDDDVLKRIRDMVIEKHRAANKRRIIRDVDQFIDDIRAEIADTPVGRVVTADPFRVAGPLHQGVFVNIMHQ